MIKRTLESFISYLPFIGKWREAFLKHSTPGHFYSPIPDLSEVRKLEKEIFNLDTVVSGIKFNLENQLELIKNVSTEMKKYNQFISSSSNLYNPDNIYYRYHDATSLFVMMRNYKPSHIIEVGSGYSSAAMLDIDKEYANSNTKFTFIEPFPENRLMRVLEKAPGKNVNLKALKIQECDLELFKSLEPNDILFIDSSHVSKVGSDLNHIIFNILPELKPGVIIHFHDVHYPFEYPKEWIYKGYAWNETYILRAFLTDNPNYRVVYMNSYLASKDKERYLRYLDTEMPYARDEAGSIWIEKLD